MFGEARARLCALVVPAPDATSEAIEAQVRAANQRLPDYARVGAWLRADEPFTPRNGFATANGRARRDALWRAYAERLDALRRAATRTAAERQALLAVPAIVDCLAGRVTRARYVAFLREAYHHGSTRCRSSWRAAAGSARTVRRCAPP